MDLWALRGLVLDVNFEAHGVPIVIRTPDGDTITTERGVWSSPVSEQYPETGARRSNRRIVMAIKRALAEHTPRGTEIDAIPPAGSSSVTWTVDAIEGEEADRVYLVLVPPDDERVTP
jgi:hypothetical protein